MTEAIQLDLPSQVSLPSIPISEDRNADENKNPNEISSPQDEQVTVFHDRDNFNVKHPLMHKWTLWFTKPPTGRVNYYAHYDIIN